MTKLADDCDGAGRPNPGPPNLPLVLLGFSLSTSLVCSGSAYGQSTIDILPTPSIRDCLTPTTPNAILTSPGDLATNDLRQQLVISLTPAQQSQVDLGTLSAIDPNVFSVRLSTQSLSFSEVPIDGGRVVAFRSAAKLSRRQERTPSSGTLAATFDQGWPCPLPTPTGTPVDKTGEQLTLDDFSDATDTDLNAKAARDQLSGTNRSVIAIIDDGVDYCHPELSDSIWRTENEKIGLDAFAELYGKNLPEAPPYPICKDASVGGGGVQSTQYKGFLSHGTMIAGIIGATVQNGLLIDGISPAVSFISCKMRGARDNDAYEDTVIRCLEYLHDLDAGGEDIVAVVAAFSFSPGTFGTESQSRLRQDVERLRDRGILVITSAGRDLSITASRLDLDQTPRYPASLTAPNVLSVTATDRQDRLLPASPIGSRTIHIAAQGDRTTSFLAGRVLYDYLEPGNSAATAHTAGVVALIDQCIHTSCTPQISLINAQTPRWAAIRNLVIAGGTPFSPVANATPPPAASRTISSRRLRAYEAPAGRGALTCERQRVRAWLQPRSKEVSLHVGERVQLEVIDIDCANAASNGPIQLNAQRDGTTIDCAAIPNGCPTLADDGVAPDEVAHDGIYSTNWPPPSPGDWILELPRATNNHNATVVTVAATPPSDD